MKTDSNATMNHASHVAAHSGRERGLSNDTTAEGRKRTPLATVDIRGARLFRFKRPNGGGFYWKAEMAVNGDRLHRRFGDELHARAWLSLAFQPFTSAGSFDHEEMNAPFRADCFRSASLSKA